MKYTSVQFKAQHATRVGRRLGSYQALCSCGWSGTTQNEESWAEIEAQLHATFPPSNRT